MLPNSRKLLDGVAARMRLVNLGRRWRWIFLSLCTVYAVALIASRGTGWGTGQFLPVHLPILAVISLAVSALFHRKPTASDAARRVDVHGQTRDLFLTVTMLGNSAGEFQQLVMQSAETTALKFKPSQVVQFPWQNPCLQAGIAAVVVWCGITQFPQFDPFGKVAEAKEAVQRVEKLNTARRATSHRLPAFAGVCDGISAERDRKNGGEPMV